ncbi:MAG: protein kinase [Fermentimonas sp.]|nr:protein kinase [Fermentimonas sp.]
MKTIQIHSSFSTNILLDFQNVTTIEIESKPIAEGAFGEVYICKSVNGKSLSVPQVIKLFKEDNQNRQDHNFNTVQKLQRKIEAKNQQIKINKGKNITDEYPALKGIPQFSFEGSVNGKKYRGFSSTNLKKIGFEEFIDILDKPNLYKSYQKISIDKKMLIAFHLASGFKLLQEIFFIHADLKPEAIFINTKTNECAIIDFDSGTITENPDDRPNVWGAPNDWVAPEIWEQLKQIGSGGLQQVKVNLLSDLWSVAVGIHYILTTTHPLFYLNELSPRVTKQYFNKYKWPEIQEAETYFNQGNRNIYLQVRDWLEKKLPKQIYTQLYNTVNYGYSNPIKRTTYNEWEKVLSSVQKAPEIQKFSFNLPKILSGSKVSLEWEITNSTNTKISSLGSVKSNDKIEIAPTKTSTYKLIAENTFGKIEQEISIKVLPLPKISEFKTNHQKIEYGRETSLIWSVENAVKAELSYNGILETLSFINEKKVLLKESTTFKLIITALDGKTTIEKELTVEVFKRVKINSFQSNLDFVVESLPITLSWEVENATKLTLTSNFQPDIDVTGKTSIKLKPKRNAILFLKASNDLFTTQERIEIEVQALPSMPRIQNIIPNSKELIPTFNLDFQNISDSILSKSELDFEKTMKPINGFSLKSSISKIFKTNRKNGI